MRAERSRPSRDRAVTLRGGTVSVREQLFTLGLLIVAAALCEVGEACVGIGAAVVYAVLAHRGEI